MTKGPAYKNNMALILKETSVFVLTWLGDSTIVKRMSLVNTLVIFGPFPPIVVEINDCSNHMVDSGKKDVHSTASLFEDKLVDYDKAR